MSGLTCERYRFGAFLLDVRERSLARDGRPVPLKPKTFDLLVALVRRAGHLARKEELLAEVWPDTIVSESNLSHSVWLLRRALEDARTGPVIETVPRAGYRFVAPVSAVAAALAVPLSSGVESDPSPSPAPAPRVRGGALPRPGSWAGLGAAAILAALAAVGVLGRGLWTRPESQSEVGHERAAAGAAESPRAGLPDDAEARRLYLAGRERLRASDPLGARHLLAEAAAKDPDSPLVLAALASAHFALGEEDRGRKAARRAAGRSEGLGEEDRLWVEAVAARSEGDWDAAVAALQRLFALAPGRLDYGAELSAILVRAERAQEALLVVGRLRQLPPPLGDDPMVDYAEGRAAWALADVQRALVAAERVIEAGDRASGVLLARAHGLRAGVLMELGEHQAAAGAWESMHRTAEATGDTLDVARALHGSGLLADRQGDTAQAEERFGGALAAYRAGGDRRAEANVLADLAGLQMTRGQLRAARLGLEQALALEREVRNLSYETRALSNLGTVLAQLGELRAAEARFREALLARRRLGDKIALVYSLSGLAWCLIDLGDLGEVDALLSEAEALARDAGSGTALGLTESARGELAAARGDLGRARAAHEAALALRRELGVAEAILDSEENLARAAFLAGDREAAQQAAERAVGLLRRLGRRADEGAMEALRARCLLAGGDLETAAEALARARRLVESAEALRPRLEVALAEAEWQAAAGRPAAAEAGFAEVQRQAEEAGLVALAMTARLARARLLIGRGERAQARGLLHDLSSEAARRGLHGVSRQAERLLAESAAATAGG